MGLMICGFAFAFMVINFGLKGDIFQSPWKSIMTTLTMTLGEFNFGDLYEAFGADVVSRGFAMFLLLLLIVLGTITMVNLFVVVIISDLTKLQQEVFHQSLVNMATASILVESLLPSRMLWRCRFFVVNLNQSNYFLFLHSFIASFHTYLYVHFLHNRYFLLI